MRIFVSSSFEDLREHRAAALRVLRQLGHEVVAMEDMVAGTVAPLAKVLDMVDRSEAYVGLFAWRYGYVPKAAAPGANRPVGAAAALPAIAGAVPGQTSITHYEYLRAKARGIPILAFLLDEKMPWMPGLVDGFDPARPDAPENTARIRALRNELQTEKVVSWFTTPSDLEARVAAAVTMAGLSRQIDVQPAATMGGGAGDASVLDSAGGSIAFAIGAAQARQKVFKIDLRDPWWSTRLYLIAALSERLTQVRRILVVRSDPPAGAELPNAAFVGQIATATVIATIRPMVPALATFERWLLEQPAEHGDVRAIAQRYLVQGWAPAFGGTDPHRTERDAKIDLSAEVLQRWFGDAMLQQAVEINDLKRASVVDLLRLLDYPSEHVPVLTGRVIDRDEPVGQIHVLDKAALNARLAHTYLNELKERARIV